MQRESIQIKTRAAEQTAEIGKRLGKVAMSADVFALIGDLGAGKTQLTQGIAAGWGISPDYQITSPTFTLVNEYEGKRGNLYHIDTYRLADCADLMDIGTEEMIGTATGICVIEWADKVMSALPPKTVFVYINHLGENSRLVEISSVPDVLYRFRTSVLSDGSNKKL